MICTDSHGYSLHRNDCRLKNTLNPTNIKPSKKYVMVGRLRDIWVLDFSVHTFSPVLSSPEHFSPRPLSLELFSPGLYSLLGKWTFQSQTFQYWTFQSKTFQYWTFQSKTFQSWTFQSQTLQSIGKMNFSVPDFSVLNFTVQDLSVLNFSVPDFSVLNFSVPDLSVPDFTVPRAKWTLQSKTKTTTFWVLFYFFLIEYDWPGSHCHAHLSTCPPFDF